MVISVVTFGVLCLSESDRNAVRNPTLNSSVFNSSFNSSDNTSVSSRVVADKVGFEMRTNSCGYSDRSGVLLDFRSTFINYY